VSATARGNGYRLQLVGPLRLSKADSLEPVAVPNGRAATLLALLAVHRNHVVELDVIVDALWPAGHTPGAPQIVASLVSRLRRVAGPAIERVGRGYRLDTSGWIVDLDEAERLVTIAERHLAACEPALACAAARRALDFLGSGHPLEGLRSRAWADDLDATTAVLLRRARQATWTGATALHDPRQAAAVAADAAAANPFDEEAHRALMLAQYQLGEPGAALVTYARLRRALGEELGSEPDPQTETLHLRILRGENIDPRSNPGGRSATLCRPPSESPLGTPGLVGRAETLAQLTRTWETVTRGTPATVILTGTAGMGKTETMAAVRRHAETNGGAVLAARCMGPERSLPLQPVAEAIRRYCVNVRPEQVRAAAAGVEAPLRELVPALAGILDAGRPGPHPAALQRRRLLDAAGSFITALSARQPVLFALDDAHLADPATIEALHHLCSRVVGHQVLVMVTVEEEDADQVVGVLGEFARPVALGPLSRSAVAELAAHWRVPDAATAVHAVTGGHPRFVVETLRAAARGVPVGPAESPPPQLRDAVLDHVRRAGAAVAQLLTFAAILGPRFRFDDVLRLGLPLADATAATQRALRAGLLLAHRDSLTFASDLVHRVVHDAIPEPIRTGVDRRLTTLRHTQPRPDRRWLPRGSGPFHLRSEICAATPELSGAARFRYQLPRHRPA
jgi:DNA-binding SARP family transcriptional activator